MNQLPTRDQWIEIFRDAVVFAPIYKDVNDNEITCKRPNSFNYIRNVFDLNSDSNNSGLTNRPSFFDRNLAMKGYPKSSQLASNPSVKFREPTSQLDNYFTRTPSQNMDVVIYILDIPIDKACKSSYCKNRGIEQVISDCEAMFVDILNYVSDLVYLTASGYWIKKSIAISRGQEYKDETVLITELRRLNKDILGRSIFGESMNDYSGRTYNIKLPVDRCETTGDHRDVTYPANKIGAC